MAAQGSQGPAKKQAAQKDLRGSASSPSNSAKLVDVTDYVTDDYHSVIDKNPKNKPEFLNIKIRNRIKDSVMYHVTLTQRQSRWLKLDDDVVDGVNRSTGTGILNAGQWRVIRIRIIGDESSFEDCRVVMQVASPAVVDWNTIEAYFTDVSNKRLVETHTVIVKDSSAMHQ